MKFKRILSLYLFVLLLVNPALAQPMLPPGVPAQAAEPVPNPSASPAEKISLDLKGADINEVFKLLSAKSGMTIVTSPEVKGGITVFINNLNLFEALDVICTMQSLAYVEEANNVIKVMTAAEYEKAYGKKFGEQKKTTTFKLAYAKPLNVLNVINSLKSDVGKIISDESTGTIIIIDTPQATEIIGKTIKELDQPLGTVVFNVNYARFSDIKSYLNDLITPGVGQVIVDERSSKVIVYDLPQRLNRIRELMKEFDEQSRQVLISGEIVEVAVDDKFQSGIAWDKIFNQDLDNLELVGNFPVVPALSSYGKISVGSLAQNHYNIVMNLLNTYGSTKILTRPRIVVVNKEEAKILVGTREAYVTATQSQAESSTLTAESVQFIDVGLKLAVVPTIGSDGYITMKIKPEVSSVQSTLTTTAGTVVPIVATSQSETVVKVKDGNMLIIAGMIKPENDENDVGLPILSRMPILGHFFSNRSREKKRTEIVIFITPTIITGVSNVGREVKNEN